MTFDATQIGPLGRTIELYEFAQSGFFTRVTSAATTQFAGVVEFIPLEGLSRSEPVQGNEVFSGDITIEVPASFSIAQQFKVKVPSSLPSLTITKKHLNDPAAQLFTYWKGTVVSCAFGDQTAVLRCQPITRVFNRPIPRAVYSAVCNHQLYDQGCTVTRADYTNSLLVISTIDPVGTTLTIAGLRAAAATIDSTLSLGLTGQELDDFWNRGILATLASPAEFRMIVETDIGGFPDVIRVNLGFRELSAGAAIEVIAGCPHSLDFCNRKFKNAEFFGGFPFVPTKNPFEIELDRGDVVAPQTGTPTFFGFR